MTSYTYVPLMITVFFLKNWLTFISEHNFRYFTGFGISQTTITRITLVIIQNKITAKIRLSKKQEKNVNASIW